ncbi:MAG: hypothetical protein II717_03825 [Lachnospiraceae bacterium]|nr:hypothetical protein [Lachnospiraceae bacterium]
MFQKESLKELNKKNMLICIPFAIVLSAFFALSYILMGQYRDHNTLTVLFSSSTELIKSILKGIVFTIALSITFIGLTVFNTAKKDRANDEKIDNESSDIKDKRNKKKKLAGIIIVAISSIIMIASFTPWLLMNYPGSANPDTELQFKIFLGDSDWTNWQPVVSTLIMGSLFSIGRSIVDANFGFFLYNVVQTIVAIVVFNYLFLTLRKMRLPIAVGFIILAFYTFWPLFGGYSQWVEKDYLFALFMLWDTVIIADIIYDKKVSTKNIILLLIVSVLCTFLRNNGVHAILPALVCLIFTVKKIDRIKVISIAAAVLLIFECATRIVYPALDINKTSISETIGFMFQQTARYVNTYPNEVTEEEKAVLIQNFQSYDTFNNYDPTINDPVKIYYNHSTPKEYFTTWFKMFLKHPFIYVDSYLNGSFGYLAPVKTDTGAYIMTQYPTYMEETMGLHHTVSRESQEKLIKRLNGSSDIPILRLLNMPGLYTWLLIGALFVALASSKKKAAIPFIPGLITIAVCTVSPLACAMRYAFGYVICVPFLIAWIFVSPKDKQNVLEINKIIDI